MDRKIDAGNRLARYGRGIPLMGPRSARMKIKGVPMRILAWVICCLAASASAATEAQVRLSGKVIDETKVAVSRAFVSLQPADVAVMPGNSAWHTVSDPTGAFQLELPTAGRYLLRAEREGFFLLENYGVDLRPGPNDITVELEHQREIYESVDVSYSPTTIDLEQTAAEKSVGARDVLAVPHPSSHSLQNALRMMPGAVTQDAEGEIHFNGGAADQIYWTLDGFNITDPLTGRFRTDLSVEAARSLTLSSGRYSAEYGKGSAGAFDLRTGMGDDRFRYSATNFVPGIEHSKGLILGDWRPRVNFSGPAVKGRAWFFNSLSAAYDKHVVEELPRGEDRTTSYGFSNLLRGQLNLTRSNILHSGILLSAHQSPRRGLGVLDPQPTTLDVRSRQAFFHIKDQQYFKNGMVLEFGYGRNATFGREIPQGTGLYILTPQGRRGSYFADARRWSTRHQWLGNFLAPSFSFAGDHGIRGGVDLNAVEYSQDVVRTGYERRSLDGAVRHRVLFAGDGAFSRSNTEFAWYVQDVWKPRARLVIELGLRQDWDRIVRNWALSPRLSVNWSPPGWDDTKLSAGYAIVHDATSLRMFTRHLDQYTLTTVFDTFGDAVPGARITAFEPEPRGLRSPRYQNWSAGLEQRLPWGFFARTNYLRKRGRDGFAFTNRLSSGITAEARRAADFGGAGFDAVYQVMNFRRDVYDALEITVRKNFLKQYTWLGSYTRSRALSNSVLDISVETLTTFADNFGPMPWDAPHRLLSWSYFPLSEKWALAYMLEWRSGYPFSVENEEGHIIGAANSRRFPDFFELNVHLERRFDFRGHRWALRGGVNNLTGRLNPTVVNNNISSPDFLLYAGGTSRAFVTRIRWLGKKE